MHRFLLAVFLGSWVMFGGTKKMESQEPLRAAEYDNRALRVESRDADRVVVRGREGTVLGKLSGFRGGLDLATVVAPSAEAVRAANDFTRTYRRGTWTMTAGLIGISAGLLVSSIGDVDPAVSTSGDVAAGAGVILAIVGAAYLNKAYTALAKSIWWYNRDLGR
jgi:hypothetical protein